MDKVQKHNSFNTNTPSSESYRNYLGSVVLCVTHTFKGREGDKDRRKEMGEKITK
jgi:hypothetical protein